MNAALGNALQVVLFHGTGAFFPGDVVVASLGVDNIRAVPEPATLALVGMGLLLLRARRPARC